MFETIVADATLTVLPIWFIALLLAKGLKQLDQFVRPVAGHMPPQIAHPRLLAVLLLPALCFGFGVILRSAMGKTIWLAIERFVSQTGRCSEDCLLNARFAAREISDG